MRRPKPEDPPSREQVKGHLDLLLMTVLENRPAHGYEIIASLRERSDGTFDLPEGTVYPALHRLEAAGWLASDWATIGGRRRRTYRLTADGRSALAAQVSSWRVFSRSITAVLGVTA